MDARTRRWWLAVIAMAGACGDAEGDDGATGADGAGGAAGTGAAGSPSGGAGGDGGGAGHDAGAAGASASGASGADAGFDTSAGGAGAGDAAGGAGSGGLGGESGTAAVDASVDSLDATGGVAGADADEDAGDAETGLACVPGGSDAAGPAAAGAPYYVAGSFYTEITLGASTLPSATSSPFKNAYLARVEEGSIAWAVRVASSEDLTAHTIEANYQEDVYLAVMIVASGANPVVFESVSAASITRVPSQAQARESFVAKYDKSGQVQWVRRIGFGSSNGGDWHGFAVLALEDFLGSLTIAGERTGGGIGSDEIGVFGEDVPGDGLTYSSVSRADYGFSFDATTATGAPVDGSLRIVQSPNPNGIIGPRRGRNLHAPNGDFVLAGNNLLSASSEYYMNYNTSGPLLIGPGVMVKDAWVGKISPSAGYQALWAYRIGGPETDYGGGPYVLSNGDVLVAGLTESDVVDFHHGGGSVSLPTSAPSMPPPNGWFARYTSDGSAVVWAKAVLSSGDGSAGVSAVEEPACTFYAGGSGSGNVLVGAGEPAETSFDLGAPVEWGAFLARFELETGQLTWAKPIPSSNSSSVLSVEREGTDGLVVWVAYAGDVTFDPAGPAELTLSAPGDRVHGVARYTTGGAFQGFTEVFRKPAAASYDDYVHVAVAK